jgi:hypothetical protein
MAGSGLGVLWPEWARFIVTTSGTMPPAQPSKSVAMVTPSGVSIRKVAWPTKRMPTSAEAACTRMKAAGMIFGADCAMARQRLGGGASCASAGAPRRRAAMKPGTAIHRIEVSDPEGQTGSLAPREGRATRDFVSTYPHSPGRCYNPPTAAR